MKHKLFILIVLAVLTTSLTGYAAFQKIEGNSNTSFGEYTLTETDQIAVINNVAYKVWALNYKNSDQTFEVLAAPGNKTHCCFIVRNENFEVQYSRENGKFGAKLVDSKRSTIKKTDVLKQISNDQLSSQEVLTTNERTQKDYLGLVASFMPLLFS
jgi:hypothetical protein